MDRDQTTEYASAFVVGILVGIGAAMLFAPNPPTRRERIKKQLKPYRKQFEKRAAATRKQVSDRASAAAEWGDELMANMRSEMAGMVAEARSEIANSVADQLESAQKTLKQSAKRIRS
jgi:gas vesicle protein